MARSFTEQLARKLAPLVAEELIRRGVGSTVAEHPFRGDEKGLNA